MTRSTQLHAFSVLVGLGIAVMALFTMAQSADLQGTQNVAVVNPMQIAPHPRDFVQIKEGTPFVVPVGRIFVLTALGGNTSTGSQTYFRVNGIAEVRAAVEVIPGGIGTGGVGNGTTVKEIPQGLSVPAGNTIEVTVGASAPDDARAWGYLVEA